MPYLPGLYHFGKSDPDPNQRDKLDPDPHQSQKRVPDPHQELWVGVSKWNNEGP
jgi:hypothetical protein